MREKIYIAYLLLLLGISVLVIGFLQLRFGQIVFLLSLFAVSFSALATADAFSSLQKIKGKKIEGLFIAALILAVVDFGVPYLFLKDIGSFYASWLFWVILTLIVLIVGNWRVSKWGE